jgi:hypothetical protein
MFITCEGAQDSEMGRRLDQAFRRGGQGGVRSLRFGSEPSETDWVRGTAGAVDRAGGATAIPRRRHR